MTAKQSALAYQQFTAALAAWWNNPGRHAFRKPELADFDGMPEMPESAEKQAGTKKQP